MKKFGVVMMSVLAIILGSFLAACNFKKVEVNFTQSEIVLSQGETIDLEQFVQASEVSLEQISYRFSNPDMFDVRESKITAKNISGKCFVYATYKGNSLASMQLVVKKRFDAPSNFSLNQMAILQWQQVYGEFSEGEHRTVATNYIIEGRFFTTTESGEEISTDIYETVNTNSFRLSKGNGIYKLKFTTQGTGYFDNSTQSAEQTFYVGFMPKLTISDFSWNDGTLSWNAIAGAKYTIKVGGETIAENQTQNWIDLTSKLEDAETRVGKHFVKVTVSDVQNKKFDMESESVAIFKLATPTVSFVNGQMLINAQGATEFGIALTSKDGKTIEFKKSAALTNFEEGLSFGSYNMKVVALGNSVKDGKGAFNFHSGAFSRKIYKLATPTIVGTGNNPENGDAFNLSATANASINCVLTVFDDGVQIKQQSISASTQNFVEELSLDLTSIGKHALTAKLTSSTNSFVDDENEIVFVLNSDGSQPLDVVKVGVFDSAIVHEYDKTTGESVLSFKKVPYATNYDLVLGAGTTLKAGVQNAFGTVQDKESVTIKFSGKIENMFDSSNGEYNFKVVAKTENSLLAINSSAIKTLNMLSAPIAVSEMNSTEMNFVWSEVTGAEKYRLEIYDLTREGYDKSVDDANFVPQTLQHSQELDLTHYTFAKEGYYCVRVFALNDNENEYLSSQNFLQKTFYIQKQLVLGQVGFGYDASLINQEGWTDASGYFLQIASTENVDNFDIFVGGRKFNYAKAGEKTTYLLSDNFESGTCVVRVVGKGNDETVYISTTAFVLNVERIESITEQDLGKNLLIYDFKPNQTVSVLPKTGVTEIQINGKAQSSVKIEGDDFNNFALRFDLVGTALDAKTHLYDVSEDGKVYLDAMQSSINFIRLASPTSLEYYDGNLNFTHSDISRTSMYVLDLQCATNNPNEMNLISIRFGDVVMAHFGNFSIQLESEQPLISIGNGSAYNECTIFLDKVIDSLKRNETLAAIYNQAKEIGFAVYAHQTRYVSADGQIELSSAYSCTKEDVSKTQLQVKKMESTTLEFDTESGNLTWQEVSVNASALTKYEIFVEDEENCRATISGVTSWNISENWNFGDSFLGKNFYVKVTNANFLESANSNFVQIKKLNALSYIATTSDGTISFRIKDEDVGVCQKVALTIDGTNVTEIALENGGGVFGLLSDGTSVLTDGEYAFTLLGSQKVDEIDGTKYYYLDSNPSTWTLTNLNSSTIAPDSKDLTIADNEISWSKLNIDTNLDALEYVLIFKDSKDKKEIYRTTNLSVNWVDDKTLSDHLKSFAEGEILIGLSAYIKLCNIASGGTIYYSDKVTLLSGSEEFNHLQYNQTSIKKLATPKVEKVEFKNPESTAAKPDTQTPTIKVTVSGDYGQTATFQVYRGNGKGEEPIFTVPATADDDGNYAFTLSVEDYNPYVSAGETLKFCIYALNRGENASAIMSSMGEVVIARAHDLTGLSFGQVNGQLGFTQQLDISYDQQFNSTSSSEITGGIVLKFVFDDGGTETVLYRTISTTGAFETSTNSEEITFAKGLVKFDMSTLLKTYLPNGGNVTVEAFIKSHSDGTTHILSSNIKASETFTVLKCVNTVTMRDDGFEIDDTNNGAKNLVYVAKMDLGTIMIFADTDGKYFFSLPKQWEDGQHKVTIYASQEGKVISTATEISITLNRIASVGQVTLLRGVDNLSKLSWDAVPNAAGYVLRVYRRSQENNKGALLYRCETEQSSFKLVDLFGENYANLSGEGKLTNFEIDNKIWIDIVTKAKSGQNNSYAKQLFATIKGNATTADNIQVDKFGNIVFNRTEQNYLYRFVSGNGELLFAEDGTALSNWTEMTSNVLDTSMLKIKGLPFNLEVIVAGDLQKNDIEGELNLDSIVLSTVTMENAPTFHKIDAISSIDVDASAEGGLTFTLPTNDFDFLYVGFAKDAILKASQSDEIVVSKIVPTLLGRGNENNEFVYTFPLADILSILEEADFAAGPKTLYFWVYKAKDPSDSSLNNIVVSDFLEFEFNLQSSPEYVATFNGKYTTDKNVQVNDFVNTYVTFKNNDTLLTYTVGMFVKFSWESGTKTIFVTKDEMLKNEDKFLGYSINLIQLIENDEDLKNLSGALSVDFARASVTVTGLPLGESLTYSYNLSNWLSVAQEDKKPLEFYRLESVQTVELVNGNLTWEKSGQYATNYYVYFFTDIETNAFTFVSTDGTIYNVSDFAGKDVQYCLAVQAIDENNTNTLASLKVFKLEGNEPQLIYKNQINSALKLKGGKLYIDWTMGDFYNKLTQPTDNFAELAKQLVDNDSVFTSPFTFNLKSLVEGNIYLRMRFSSSASGTVKTFDINAMDLLENLIEFARENSFDMVERLDTLYEHSENLSVTERRLLDRFAQAVKQGTYGVANTKYLFDNVFESLQMGRYSLEYCLITENGTMNSEWYSYENANGENVVFVNGEPTVDVKIEPKKGSEAMNEFKIIVEKSQIWDYASEGYATETAERYVLKLGQNVYSIYKDQASDGSFSYKLMQMDVEQSKVIPVYECGADGDAKTGSGYLMFYLNYNEGKSILGAFGNKEKGAQEMQIYAVGNDCSISSKSKYFSVTFLNFDSFNVVEGTFVWTTYNNRETTVLIKNSRSSTWEIPVSVDGSYATAQFNLEGKAGGTYSLMFVMKGEKRSNAIIVDSDIYAVETVYKLDAPSLNNTKGYIAIDVEKTTKDNLANAYSDSALYRYVISNDRSSGTTRTFSGNENGNTYFYEAGATNLSTTDPDYAYKSTEERATKFEIGMLGSTATLTFKQDEVWDGGFNKNYYIKNILCLDAHGNETEKGIALRSSYTSLPASMLSNVERESLVVENGILKWKEVTGRADGDKTNVADGASVVYKVTISRYTYSTTVAGTAPHNVTDDLHFYTANNFLDLSILTEDLEIEKHNPYIGVTVQALALDIVQESDDINRVSLVEGGCGTGNVKYESDEDWFVLMSNGVNLRDIGRINPVEGLDVENGQLVWNFTTTNTLVSTDNFRDYYDFIVTDDEGKVIEGEFAVVKDGDVFKVTFSESVGQMKAGEYAVSVYVTQGKRNADRVIKSFARKLDIKKLSTIVSGDYVVISDLGQGGDGTETLSLQEYFQTNPENVVRLSVETLEGTKTYTFDKWKNKLYILKAEPEEGQILNYGDEYVTDENGKGYIVVGSNSVQMTFKVFQTSTTAKIVFSDLSENFALHRTSWQGYAISWDEQSQKFAWNFDLNSFNRNVAGVKMEYVDVLTLQTPLLDATGAQVMILEAGTQITVLDVSGSGNVKIAYENQEYFIARNSFEKRLQEVTNSNGVTETETLDVGKLFKIVESGLETSIISIEDDGVVKLYKVASNAIINPIFIVEATYTNQRGGKDIRTYTTNAKEFLPTVIGKVQIKISIKINDINLLSEECESQEATFNLFASGDGTAENPYAITNAQQFKNMSQRMTKPLDLTQFTVNGQTIKEEEKFYFNLDAEINLGAIDGILFAGEFGGVLDGKNHSITYVSTGVKALTNVVRVGDTLLSSSDDGDLIYTHASSVFENFASSANVKNLNINATFGAGNSVKIQRHSLMAGLVVVNNGRVENINLTKFENHFYGDYYDSKFRALMTYSGIASINSSFAILSECSTKTNMQVYDYNNPQIISLAAIAYTNYGTIEKCVSGTSGQKISVECDDRRDSVQVAGIVVTNATNSATITECQNNYVVEVTNWSSSNITCFLAGIVALSRGTVDETNINNGGMPVASSNVNATIGNICAKQA